MFGRIRRAVWMYKNGNDKDRKKMKKELKEGERSREEKKGMVGEKKICMNSKMWPKGRVWYSNESNICISFLSAMGDYLRILTRNIK